MSLRAGFNAGRNVLLGILNLIQTDPTLNEHITSITLLIAATFEISNLSDRYLQKRASPQEKAYGQFLKYLASSVHDVLKDLADKDDKFNHIRIDSPNKIYENMLSAYDVPDAWNSYLPDNSVAKSFLNLVLNCLKDSNISADSRDEFYLQAKIKLENAKHEVKLTEFFKYSSYTKQRHSLICYLNHVESLINEEQEIDKRSLKDYYIPLQAARLPIAEAFRLTDSEIRDVDRDIQNAEDAVSNLLAKESYVIIAAHFGVGKSSLCKMMASKYASAYLDSDQNNAHYIPIIVSLKNGLSVDYKNYSLYNILRKVITSEQSLDSKQRHILLILDGLEEYDSPKPLYEEIELLRSDYENLRTIITTRLDNSTLTKNRVHVDNVLRLLQFDENQLTEFMQNYGIQVDDLLLNQEVKLPLFAWIYTLVRTELEEIRGRKAYWTQRMIRSWIFLVLVHSIIRGKYKGSIHSDERSFYVTEKHTLRFIAQQKSIFGNDLTLDKLNNLISQTVDDIKFDLNKSLYPLHITNSADGKLIEFIHESFREYLLAEYCLHSILYKKFHRLSTNGLSNETIWFLEGLIDIIKVSDKDPVSYRQIQQDSESLFASFRYDGSAGDFLNTLRTNSLQYLGQSGMTLSFVDPQAERTLETNWREVVTKYDYYLNPWLPYWICLYVNRKIQPQIEIKNSAIEYIVRVSSNIIPSALRYLPSVNMSQSYLLCVNLRFANMSFSTINNSMLQNSTLAGANLSHASIKGSDLSFCDLMDTDLSGINAMKTDFHGSALIDANLAESNLSHCNLENCNLYGADLTKSVLIGINIKNERAIWGFKIGPISIGGSAVKPMLNVLGANFSNAIIDDLEIVEYLRSHDAVNVPDAITDKNQLEAILTDRGFTKEDIIGLLHSE